MLRLLIFLTDSFQDNGHSVLASVIIDVDSLCEWTFYLGLDHLLADWGETLLL